VAPVFSSKPSNSLLPYKVASGSKKDESSTNNKSKGIHDGIVSEPEECPNDR
jgi:hypothetical protein